MDREKFGQINLSDLRDLTDQELEDVIKFADSIVSYNRIPDSVAQAATTVMGVVEAYYTLQSAGTGRVASAAAKEAKAVIASAAGLTNNIFGLNRQVADLSTRHTIVLQEEALHELTSRFDRAPWAGPDNGVASNYDGDPGNDGDSPLFSLFDARRAAHNVEYVGSRSNYYRKVRTTRFSQSNTARGNIQVGKCPFDLAA